MAADTGLQRIRIEPIPPAVETPHADAERHDYLLKLHGEGRWNGIIDFEEGYIADFIRKLPSPILSNSEVVSFFFASEAYKARQESDKYAACLKLLYSIEPFRKTFGGDYRKYLDMAAEEYVALADEVGEDRLNQLDVTTLFKKKSGCFIATACYDSYNSPEVLVLRAFRDEVLLKNRIGRTFVQFYYVMSPAIANFIAKERTLKRMIKVLLLNPLVALAKRQDRSGH